MKHGDGLNHKARDDVGTAAASGQRPAASGQRPAASGQRPAARRLNRKAAKDAKERRASSHQPPAASGCLSSSVGRKRTPTGR
ncbi:hypothetical protein EBL85_05690 [Marichromatium sp. AB32]|nr:hypothetical protein EBL85_05690 [Marichromatium sp. AB32]